MDAEIIAVGSEMLTPERVDTNSLYLTGELNKLGVEVVTKSVIGDDRDRLADAVRRALSRTGIVILSGRGSAAPARRRSPSERSACGRVPALRPRASGRLRSDPARRTGLRYRSG